MKKVAFYVEGQTELIFVSKLLREIAGAKNIRLHQVSRHKSNGIRRLESDPVDGQKYFAIVVDCGSDNKVASSIVEDHAGLMGAGYQMVVGLRDLYPQKHSALPKIKRKMLRLVSATSPAVHLTIAIAEVEAWFIQDDTHFPKINRFWSRTAILRTLNHDILTESAENLAHPTDFLKKAYRLGRASYTKSEKSVNRTIAALDFFYLYFSRRHLLSSFDEFASHIEAFLT